MNANKPHAMMLLLLLLLIVGAGCPARQQWIAPAGFAVYPNEKPLKAVSPDGVVYRVRVEPNKQYRAGLPFWKEAMKKRMLDVGYVFQRETDITANGKSGYLLELAAPVGAKDYLYLIAFFIDDEDNLVIMESAGEVTRFDPRRKDIVTAIQTTRF
ncbi:MAG: hypothetical protein ACOZF0_03370 [Thermodesulfobacteriota bacterium]